MSQPNQIAQERMFLNADKTKALPEGHKDAAFLYAGVGDEIPASACERFGIVDGKLGGKPAEAPAKAKAAAKSKPAPANKEKAPAEDKGAGE